jgi:hypothetical protein
MSNDESMEVRCNHFANRAKAEPNWVFSKVIEFLQFQKERVENKEISSATLRNFVKAIKLFCEMADIDIKWIKVICNIDFIIPMNLVSISPMSIVPAVITTFTISAHT